MATKKTGPGNGIMKYAPKVTTTTTKKTTSASSGKSTTSTGGGKKTTSYVGKPTTSNTGGKKTTTTTPSTGSKTTTTNTNKPMQKSTDPNRYFVGERRGTSPTQEVSYGEYQKAYKNPNLVTAKINKADTAKINNLTRSYGANEIKGFVKKKVK